jgi:hypothetical protein
MPDDGLGMGQPQGERQFMEFPRCPVCDDIIGVYEPLMHVRGGLATRTSRAAEPEICTRGQCFHLACYEGLADEA